MGNNTINQIIEIGIILNEQKKDQVKLRTLLNRQEVLSDVFFDTSYDVCSNNIIWFVIQYLIDYVFEIDT